MKNTLPVALTIAGSDCSAGAGIQADLKTFQHFHVHGLTAVTCVVSETANIVRAVHPVPVEIVADQISLLLESFPVAAVKTGMLFSAAHVTAVAEILRKHDGLSLVVDPVMIASTGASLLEPAAIDCYKNLLLPLARVSRERGPGGEGRVLEPSPHNLRHRREVVGADHGLHFEAAVLVRRGLAIDEHDHARYGARALDVRVVITLYAARRRR